MKKLLLLSLTALMISSCFADYYADVYFFWGEGCGYCAKAKPFLESLVGTYPLMNLKAYEVWHNSINKDYFLNMTGELNISSRGVPVIIIGDEHWIGYSNNYDSAIIAQVEECIANGGCGASAEITESAADSSNELPVLFLSLSFLFLGINYLAKKRK